MSAVMFTADWLMEQEFPPLEYVVPGIIPEGLSLLVSPPKIGKSWFALDLAVAVAGGGHVLDVIYTGRPRPVLYLALEDGQRRLQDRLKVLGVADAPSNLFFSVSVTSGDVIGTIREWMAGQGDQCPLVILDTLGKVMPAAQAGESDYQRDYRIGGALKSITDEYPGSSMVVVHHTRKAGADDFLDTVSGTQGLAGAADTIIVLRRPRGETTGSLSVTSRDAAEGEYQVTLDGGHWRLDGADLHDAAAALAEHRATDGLGDRAVEVIAVVNAHPEGVRAGDVAETLGITPKDAGTYLLRAFESGRIARPSRGLYRAVGSAGSVGIPAQVPTLPTLPTPVYGRES